MNCNQAKHIKITDFLKSLNIEPDKILHNGRTEIYKAPYRNEAKASLHVNTEKNIWFDHGAGTGGTIIDLVMNIFNTDLKESLIKLESENFNTFSFQQQKREPKPVQKSAIETISIKPIEHPALISYVKERKISLEIAKLYLKEIKYKIWNSNICDYKIYFSLGFKNDLEGYELRNKIWQGCTTKKYFTTINGVDNSQLNIFEGFFDFLSAIELSKTKQLKYDSLVLNSVNQSGKTLDLIKQYKKVNLFLDNDPPGVKTANFYKKNHASVIDYSTIIYPFPFNDLNDFLVDKK